jgi:flagellar biosynthetic protein FliR
VEIASTQIAAWVGAFLWPFARIGGMLAVAPVFGARIMPMRVRLIFALVLTWVVQPSIHALPGVDPLSPVGALVVLHQLLVGVAMGFVLQLAFAALMFGGQILAASMGLGFAAMVDPQNGIQVPTIGQYYLILAILLFFAADGHLLLIRLVAGSFLTLPVDAAGLSADTLWYLASWGAVVFSGGVLIALPAATAVLITNLAFGVATRLAPQLNIFAVGFPVAMLVGFGAMMLTLPELLPRIGQLLEQSFDHVRILSATRP